MTEAANKVRHDYTLRDLILPMAEIQTYCHLLVYEAAYLRCELLLAVVRECRDNSATLTFMVGVCTCCFLCLYLFFPPYEFIERWSNVDILMPFVSRCAVLHSVSEGEITSR